MSNKVFMVTVDADAFAKVQTNPPSYLGGDIFYVRSETADKAKAMTREAIRKFYFKQKLANKSDDRVSRLGPDILVEQWVTEATHDAPLITEDITALAYLWCLEGKKDWVDWGITAEDASA